ncbi:MAG TPA: response regulator [Bryobacteraceae bacterium]|nr:response regulator [Bryobacteraceae bacterium]
MKSVKVGYLRALIVDDSLTFRSTMWNMLKRAGFKHLNSAVNAVEANSKMDALRYDIVFLDWLMPGKSGISLLEQWREDRRYDDVAIILVTAESEERCMRKAMQSGALSYIVKPFTEELLREHLGKAVKWLGQRRNPPP